MEDIGLANHLPHSPVLKEPTTTTRFPAHTVETAPEEVRHALATTIAQLGFLPSMMATFAEAPALLRGYQALAPVFDTTSLTPTERFVVSMTGSYMHDCDFCMSAHSWGARRQNIDPNIVAALRSGHSLLDAKLDALRVFVAAMVNARGAVTDVDKAAFFEAGYTPRQALEVIVGLALKVITNYTNALASTPPNAEFGEDVWQRRREPARPTAGMPATEPQS
jgi:AhpD family alkylhydroperoxidase